MVSSNAASTSTSIVCIGVGLGGASVARRGPLGLRSGVERGGESAFPGDALVGVMDSGRYGSSVDLRPRLLSGVTRDEGGSSAEVLAS